MSSSDVEMQDIHRDSNVAGPTDTNAPESNSPIGKESSPPTVNESSDPIAKFWSVYLKQAEYYDRNLSETWQDDMGALLIFAGLFSASVTAFAAVSLQDLQPNFGSQTVALLAQISQQLASANNSSAFPLAAQEAFKPPFPAIRYNILWFWSLFFSLSCALIATMVLQWAHNYTQAVNTTTSIPVKARLRNYLYQGIQNWHVIAIVEATPALLHISLFLFLAGLVDFLHSINTTVSWAMAPLVAIAGLLYSGATIIPAFDPACPIRTPLTSLWIALVSLLLYPLYKLLKVFLDSIIQQRFTYVRGQTIQENFSKLGPFQIFKPLAQRQKERATASENLVAMDTQIFSDMINSLEEEVSMLPFLEGLPCYLVSADHASKILSEAGSESPVNVPHYIASLLRSWISLSSANFQDFEVNTQQVNIITIINTMYALLVSPCNKKGHWYKQLLGTRNTKWMEFYAIGRGLQKYSAVSYLETDILTILQSLILGAKCADSVKTIALCTYIQLLSKVFAQESVKDCFERMLSNGASELISFVGEHVKEHTQQERWIRRQPQDMVTFTFISEPHTVFITIQHFISCYQQQQISQLSSFICHSSNMLDTQKLQTNSTDWISGPVKDLSLGGPLLLMDLYISLLSTISVSVPENRNSQCSETWGMLLNAFLQCTKNPLSIACQQMMVVLFDKIVPKLGKGKGKEPTEPMWNISISMIDSILQAGISQISDTKCFRDSVLIIERYLELLPKKKHMYKSILQSEEI